MQDQKQEVQRNTIWPWPNQAKAWIAESMQCMRALGEKENWTPTHQPTITHDHFHAPQKAVISHTPLSPDRAVQPQHLYIIA